MKHVMHLLVLCFISALAVLSTDVSAWPCGWPFLHVGSNRPAVLQTKLVQYLLVASGVTVTTDGVYDVQTKEAVASFQASHHMSADGVVGAQTWQVLLSGFTPLHRTAAGASVEALQASLHSYGFDVTVSGSFDNATAGALAKFQMMRGAAVSPSGSLVDAQTWHLLASGCNASENTSAFWADFGWPQGSVTTSSLQCMHQFGFRFVTFECWREFSGWFPPCVQNIQHAWSAGFEAVGVYMFPIRAVDPALQATQLVANLSSADVKYTNVMLDIEGNDWNTHGRTQAENQQFIATLAASLQKLGVKVLIYCGEQWNTYFGKNFTALHDLPLVYAHYDNIPGYWDAQNVATHYGGWSQPSGKQFWDGADNETVCGLGAVDWDWSAKPFW